MNRAKTCPGQVCRPQWTETCPEGRGQFSRFRGSDLSRTGCGQVRTAVALTCPVPLPSIGGDSGQVSTARPGPKHQQGTVEDVSYDRPKWTQAQWRIVTHRCDVTESDLPRIPVDVTLSDRDQGARCPIHPTSLSVTRVGIGGRGFDANVRFSAGPPARPVLSLRHREMSSLGSCFSKILLDYVPLHFRILLEPLWRKGFRVPSLALNPLYINGFRADSLNPLSHNAFCFDPAGRILDLSKLAHSVIFRHWRSSFSASESSSGVDGLSRLRPGLRSVMSVSKGQDPLPVWQLQKVRICGVRYPGVTVRPSISCTLRNIIRNGWPCRDRPARDALRPQGTVHR